MQLVIAVGTLVAFWESEILLQSYPLFFVPNLSRQFDENTPNGSLSVRLVQSFPALV
jgi:hypothetical protein